MIPCRTCGLTLPIDRFSIRRESGKPRLDCKPCRSEQQKARLRAEPEKVRRERNNSIYRRRYGIDLDTRESMLVAQGGVCALCGAEEPGGNGWHVDHDHSCCPEAGRSCGQCIRGILCHNCNVGLGHFRDDPELMRRAIGYLTEYAR